MADWRAQFDAAIQTEMTMLLATAGAGGVSMRPVSPAPYGDAVLLFTHADSNKYRQLTENPRCCMAVGGMFAEAAATFCGPTMARENAALREAYAAKFPGAFDEGVAFGGRDAEFLLLHPKRLSGWAFENGALTGAGIPTTPFSQML